MRTNVQSMSPYERRYDDCMIYLYVETLKDCNFFSSSVTRKTCHFVCLNLEVLHDLSSMVPNHYAINVPICEKIEFISMRRKLLICFLLLLL